MERLNAAFLAVVVVAAGVGAATAAGHGGELQARDLAAGVVGDVSVDVTNLTTSDGGLLATATVRNPTDHDLEVTGVVVRVHNRSERKLAYGNAERRAGDTALPAGGSLTATYAVNVGPPGRPVLRAALAADDAAVTIKYSLRLRGVTTTVTATDRSPGGEGT